MFRQQIEELDNIVIKKATESIIPNLKQFVGYLGEKNSEHIVRTMAYPVAPKSYKEKKTSEMRLLI